MNDLKKELDIIVKTMEDKKAQDIRVLKVDEATSLTEYFVICNGTSSTQIKTLADETEHKLRDILPILHREGYSSGNWVLLDYGAIIVHIFHKDTRDFYELEKLWEKNAIKTIPVEEEN